MWATTEAVKQVNLHHSWTSVGGVLRGSKRPSLMNQPSPVLPIRSPDMKGSLVHLVQGSYPDGRVALPFVPGPPEKATRLGPPGAARNRLPVEASFLQQLPFTVWLLTSIWDTPHWWVLFDCSPAWLAGKFSACHWFVLPTCHTCPLALVDRSQIVLPLVNHGDISQWDERGQAWRVCSPQVWRRSTFQIVHTCQLLWYSAAPRGTFVDHWLSPLLLYSLLGPTQREKANGSSFGPPQKK